jgi:hypothetical protein
MGMGFHFRMTQLFQTRERWGLHKIEHVLNGIVYFEMVHFVNKQKGYTLTERQLLYPGVEVGVMYSHLPCFGECTVTP